MADFTQDDKREISPAGANGFYEEGVYSVSIVNVTGGVSAKGSEFFEFEVIDDTGREGKVQLYFTDGAKPYSFNTVRNIFVHNAKTDAAKEKTRAKIDEVANTDDLLKLCEALRGAQAWLLVQYTGDTYTNPTSGKTYKNLNRNLYGYEPELRPTPVAEPTAAQQTSMDTIGGGEVTKENLDEVFPFN